MRTGASNCSIRSSISRSISILKGISVLLSVHRGLFVVHCLLFMIMILWWLCLYAYLINKLFVFISPRRIALLATLSNLV